MASGLKKLRIVKKAVAKGTGGRAIGMAINMHRDLPRIKTGSLALDFSLGGGIPAGRTTVLWGGESSGKTSTMYRIAGIAQGLCANCFREVNDLEVVEDVDSETGEVEYYATGTCDCYQKNLFTPKQYHDEKVDEFKKRLNEYKANSFEEFRVALFDFEGDMDFEWAETLGMDVRRLVYMRPDTAEEAIDVYEEVLRSGEVHLALLDSIALMSPSEEVEKSAHDLQQGLQARIMGKFTRKLASVTNSAVNDYGRLPTQIWINQERQKIGGYGGGKVQPAGKALLFFAAAIVYTYKQKGERVTNINDGFIAEHKQEMMKDVLINFKIEKNKTFTEGLTGMYRMTVAGENKGAIDELKYVLAMAEKHGMYSTEGVGAKKRWRLGDEEYSKKGDVMARVMELEVFEGLKKALLEKMLKI